MGNMGDALATCTAQAQMSSFFLDKLKRISVLSYNATANNGVTDATTAIQAAIDAGEALGGAVIEFPYGTYVTTSTITVSSHNIILNGNNSTINYTGASYGIDFQPISTVFPQSVVARDLNVVCNTAGATGIRWRCSHAYAYNVGVALVASNQTGVEFVGDVNGTGSYYNTLIGLRVQGKRGVTGYGSVTNQKGVTFTYDASTPTRCPNANTFIGGRVGQVDTGWTINGDGNTILAATIEGIIGTGFVFSNPGSALGCFDNKVQVQYAESANKIWEFAANSERNRIEVGYATGIADITANDSGVTNQIIWPGVIMQYPIGTGATQKGLILDPVNNVGFFTYNGTPESHITAGKGSICLNLAGGAAAAIYTKESGTGNTGWVAK